MVESLRVPGKYRIPTSIEKLSRSVTEQDRICVSTEKWQNPGEYREKVEFGRVPGKNRIRASITKLPRRVSKKGRISVSTEKW